MEEVGEGRERKEREGEGGTIDCYAVTLNMFCV